MNERDELPVISDFAGLCGAGEPVAVPVPVIAVALFFAAQIWGNSQR